jgi:hypothetical protein
LSVDPPAPENVCTVATHFEDPDIVKLKDVETLDAEVL